MPAQSTAVFIYRGRKNIGTRIGPKIGRSERHVQGAYAQENDTCGMKHEMNRIKGGKSHDSLVKQGIRKVTCTQDRRKG